MFTLEEAQALTREHFPIFWSQLTRMNFTYTSGDSQMDEWWWELPERPDARFLGIKPWRYSSLPSKGN